jgi:hypothetical protein
MSLEGQNRLIPSGEVSMEDQPRIAAVGLSFGWLCAVGLNIVIAILRFNSFVRTCAEMAGATEIQKLSGQSSARDSSKAAADLMQTRDS